MKGEMKFDVRKCLIDWAMNEWMYVWMDGCTNEDERLRLYECINSTVSSPNGMKELNRRGREESGVLCSVETVLSSSSRSSVVKKKLDIDEVS
ncbi:predicted protein [Sclerotinia sclerotiorum 1980 UF-70]|uniref:Uncharacterized protein n=1 Tax=Sclerotinia sclerotiorum (strain ATCC 18683 / 1980 / Ss-1) TaxID=665079 RepID=A7EJA3_SCLS1|nr:predicted protein [Sclerotinia sclerotiorum 1980 UF-70]EDO02919.1 predicted protein [Sclerotinia sclerotiorum 1980 UF-70]